MCLRPRLLMWRRLRLHWSPLRASQWRGSVPPLLRASRTYLFHMGVDHLVTWFFIRFVFVNILP
jgi:hypothetical protein